MNGAVHRSVLPMAIDVRSEVVFVVRVTNVVVRDVEEWTQTKTTNNLFNIQFGLHVLYTSVCD